ncbi:MAG: MarR family transcriptional regulator [Nonomuraea sp.]|nr:MarR family transcriptional regulator [Nonomuraea sp.]NUP78364.1 MarR family transcriptional regulator [Nonomuraea sp.]NUT45109.1 MarR family transcriptional regulator [Thermoactinospora sp.]
MNGVELFLLGRTLMKIGEQAMPQPRTAARGPVRTVLVVIGDVVSHPGTTVGEIATRTGLPQSQVSTAVARLEATGSVETAPDPADRRRRLIRPAATPSERVAEVRTTTIDAALAAALAEPDPEVVREVTAALEMLARRLSPEVTA